MAITNANSRKKRKKGWVIGICAVLVAGIITIPMMAGRTADKTAGYLSESAQKRTIETFYTFSGNVASADTQNVMAESMLQIKTIHVKEGDKVDTDTVLFTTGDGTEIKCKMDGTVNKILVEEDQQVMSGSQLAELIDFDHLEVTVKVDEYDLEAVDVEKEVEVAIVSLDKDVKGTISEISRTATSENGVSYFLATVKLEQAEDVKIGMTAEARIQKEEAKDVVTIPVKALSYDSENDPYVYVISEGGSMRERTITAGINDGKVIEVKEGLDDGETVYYRDPNAAQSSGSSFLPPMGGM